MMSRCFHIESALRGTMPAGDSSDPSTIGSVLLWEPDLAGGEPISGVVIGLHGSGRHAGSYRDVPFYRYQRDRSLESGYAFVSVSNGRATWGLDDGLERVISLLELLYRRFGENTTVIPWGSSAGGVMMFRLIAYCRNSRFAPITKGIGTFPVYDIESVFPFSKGCGPAWDADTPEMLAERLGDRNPPKYPDALAHCSFWIGHGKDDAVVHISTNADRLERDLSKFGGHVTVHRSSGGHSTENFDVYDDDAIAAFLKS